MKKVIATITNLKSPEVREALLNFDKAFTETEVFQFVPTKEYYRGQESAPLGYRKVVFSIDTEDDRVAAIIEAITHASRTGRGSTDNIVVTNIEKFISLGADKTLVSASRGGRE